MNRFNPVICNSSCFVRFSYVFLSDLNLNKHSNYLDPSSFYLQKLGIFLLMFINLSKICLFKT